MTDIPDLTPEGAQALRNQATADFIATVGALDEAMTADVPVADWLVELTQDWTTDHARQGVLVCGMLMASAGIDPEALAGIGRALIVPAA